jgi:hypothetical protein
MPDWRTELAAVAAELTGTTAVDHPAVGDG